MARIELSRSIHCVSKAYLTRTTWKCRRTPSCRTGIPCPRLKRTKKMFVAVRRCRRHHRRCRRHPGDDAVALQQPQPQRWHEPRRSLLWSQSPAGAAGCCCCCRQRVGGRSPHLRTPHAALGGMHWHWHSHSQPWRSGTARRLHVALGSHVTTQMQTKRRAEGARGWAPAAHPRFSPRCSPACP